MKKSVILTSLLIATVGLTSCGRKKAQVDPSTTGAIALTAEMTCASITDKDKGKLSAATFIDMEKSKVVEKDEEATEYAQRVYAKARKSDDKMEIKLLSPVFKNESDKITEFKAKNNIIVAQVGSTAEEKLEIFLFKPNAKDTKDGYRTYKSMFAKDGCEASVAPDAKPLTIDELKQLITDNNKKIEELKATKLSDEEDKKAKEDAETVKLVLDQEKQDLIDATEDLAKVKADTSSSAADIKAAEAAVEKAQKAYDKTKKLYEEKLKLSTQNMKIDAAIKVIEDENTKYKKELEKRENPESDEDESDDEDESNNEDESDNEDSANYEY